MTLTELRKLAEAAMQQQNPAYRTIELSPERILAMLDVIEAADAYRDADTQEEEGATCIAYDAARKRLEEYQDIRGRIFRRLPRWPRTGGEGSGSAYVPGLRRRDPQTDVGGMMDGLMMKYFVLKPRGTDQYAAASRAAMRKYAALISGENPELAKELIAWADKEQLTALEAST